jgi:hypothetical protein
MGHRSDSKLLKVAQFARVIRRTETIACHLSLHAAWETKFQPSPSYKRQDPPITGDHKARRHTANGRPYTTSSVTELSTRSVLASP